MVNRQRVQLTAAKENEGGPDPLIDLKRKLAEALAALENLSAEHERLKEEWGHKEARWRLSSLKRHAEQNKLEQVTECIFIDGL